MKSCSSAVLGKWRGSNISDVTTFQSQLNESHTNGQRSWHGSMLYDISFVLHAFYFVNADYWKIWGVVNHNISGTEMEREGERETKEALIQPRVISCGVKNHLNSKQFQTHEFHEISRWGIFINDLSIHLHGISRFQFFLLSGKFHENHMSFLIFSVNFYGDFMKFMNFMSFNVKSNGDFIKFHEIHEFHEFQCENSMGISWNSWNFMKFMLAPYLSFKPRQVGMLIS